MVSESPPPLKINDFRFNSVSKHLSLTKMEARYRSSLKADTRTTQPKPPETFAAVERQRSKTEKPSAY